MRVRIVRQPRNLSRCGRVSLMPKREQKEFFLPSSHCSELSLEGTWGELDSTIAYIFFAEVK